MARSRAAYVCQACGATSPRWAGRCEACGAWNSIVEEIQASRPKGSLVPKRGAPGLDVVRLHDPLEQPPPRLGTGIEELDRVLGGGIVQGSAILVGGDPGIGKSTLTLQAAAALSAAGRQVTYVSGEESTDQIRLRAARLGLEAPGLGLAAATSVAEILATLEHGRAPDLLVIDSIQTMWSEAVDSAPGTVTQLRAAAQSLIGFAKRRHTAVLFIGHVTKDGQIAGPRVLEHMVDAVLYFEGERGGQFRILRAVKNRFGPANEIGVFEMHGLGLLPVANPSALFLAERDAEVAGSAVFAGMEGSRPVLVEVQALVAPSALGTPRRAVVGWDGNRLAMILAVLETRCGLVIGPRDVYLNVAGGLRVQEPAADLAVAAALVSAALDAPLPAGLVLFGEIGLSGEIRGVTQATSRLKEAAKLGFARAMAPAGSEASGLKLHPIRRLADLVTIIGARAGEGRRPVPSPDEP
ncbi:DNA replication and repair protein RadA [Arboricoccus pini]|uniref:DNA repair protein RadA n=1 Tax=Arboricoccus pini TaxID=1963835 RepID=A0A212QXC3_9PROT|nr:DNA repair protein RadA [Arboricoccus pini]SNB64271.1 DNA replication and repair protein RadA [Arboricoccus pini]